VTYPQNRYVNALRAGLCGICQRLPRLEGRVLCERCRARQTRNNRARSAKRRRYVRRCRRCRAPGHYAKACDVAAYAPNSR
jgi:hypothetical protein